MMEKTHLPQLKPWQTERTIMRIKAIIIPKTISFIFMFCNHIFLLNWVPCCLKPCACKPKAIDMSITAHMQIQ